jgi:serine/threonine protein kinase/Tol biopolymer transport system component
VGIAPGVRLGPYEVLSPLGVGGMGEVYRARDTTLGRDVALKVLPDEVVRDKDRVARFRREAQILATLNHPLIASIYGIDESSGAPALVLELVEGPNLAERLRAGRLPLDEALAVAIQVAQALEAAHQQGIVHRDLKPANIKLRPDGTVKVLDFGLAKALSFAAGTADSDSASTETSPAMTRLGAIVGTAAYMSPEQARGHVVDRGADVWAFGAVLFEMLAGARAFSGNDTTETIASVLRADPDWSRLPARTPDSVRRVLHRCLEKDRRRRLADIRDARLDLEEAQRGAPEPPGTAARTSLGRGERLAWLATTVAALAVAAWPILRGPSSTPAPRERHVELTTPPTSDPVSLAISPDGDKVAFVALADGRSLLWVYRLDKGRAQPLRGTDGAAFPFWSPDSRSIAFVSGERLRRIDLDGDKPKTFGVAVVAAGGTWSRDGVVLYPVVPDSPLLRISDRGGPPQRLPGPERTPRSGERTPGERFPQFLPDGQHFLYYEAESRSVFLGSLDDPRRRPLFEADSAAVFAPPAELLFVRDGVLYSQGFDVSRFEARGEVVPLARGVAVSSLGAAAVSASAEGSVAYRTGLADEVRQLTWVDRSGTHLGTVGGVDAAHARNPALSPDGRRVALNRSVNGNTDLWIVDVERGIASRFTDDPNPEITPVWSPDGRSIVYSNGIAGLKGFALYLKSTATERAAVPLVRDPLPGIVMDWSHDGRFVLYRTKESPGASWDIWAVPMEGDRKPVAVGHEEFDEREAQFSPDDRWIAFESNKSGDFEIYVRPFPGPGASTRVSIAGGCQPRWRHDGAELFYVAPDGHLMATPVRLPSTGTGIVLGTPQPLFSARITSTVHGGITHDYDVSADGRRFLMNLLVEQPPTPISLILDRRPASR